MVSAAKNHQFNRISKKFKIMEPLLDERSKRLWAACEDLEISFGGVTLVSKVTGLARSTIQSGIKDVQRPGRKRGEQRIRRPGGGRKAYALTQEGLSAALDKLVEPETRGDPMTPLRWTLKSTRNLAQELQRQGFKVSPTQVRRMLKSAGYSLQANRKSVEGKQHADRDAQFQFISQKVQQATENSQPVISVDTKKKENLGRFKNPGREWAPKGEPVKVDVHDFPDPELGKVVPYGIYDIAADNGWVNLGINHDTAEFAVSSIKRWWQKMGSKAYPEAQELLITADSGGSNSYRNRAWRFFLQDFSDRTGLRVKVCHFPPGTSKWNKIEHRMFCHISRNWRGKPLTSREVVISLIGNTRTKSGLLIKTAIDKRFYPKGLKISDKEMATIRLKPATFHGEWNYTIHPRNKN